MKERPILFSGEMVRAILDGRKTQTRRVVRGWIFDGDESGCGYEPPPCPYGRPGDLLWVRETWAQLIDHQGVAHPTYRADYSRAEADRTDAWRPSIHMPRWASRITLRVTDVRVERLHDISEEDVQAEGCTGSPFGPRGDALLFPSLWDSINGKRGHPWSLNPWVWVVSFERVTP